MYIITHMLCSSYYIKWKVLLLVDIFSGQKYRKDLKDNKVFYHLLDQIHF